MCAFVGVCVRVNLGMLKIRGCVCVWFCESVREGAYVFLCP
jgi:hypothetical protein